MIMENKILAFVETRDNILKNPSFEVTTTAKFLSDNIKCEFSVLAVCDMQDEDLKVLQNYGANTIYKISLNELNSLKSEPIKYSYTAIVKTISEFAKKNSFNIIIFSGTGFGKEIAPSVAAQTESAYLPDCIKINTDGESFSISRPIYAGKAIVKVQHKTKNCVITLRPNVFKKEKYEGINAQIVNIPLSTLDIKQEDFTTSVKDVVISSEKLDVAEADKIVSGGRGLRGPENFHLIEELATVIGAATGASRAVVDAGWRPHSEQVGQTGKTVTPSLYIACGISGAIQHLAGMSSSKCIVAINKDKDAPIFQIADYGIVGDVFDVLPALTNEIKKIT